jgi:hypothetical protein
MSEDNENILKQEQLGMIQVTRLEENEDGSANLEIETSPEATRLLVEIGLTSLLEKALDKENEDYSIDKLLLKGKDDEQETPSV